MPVASGNLQSSVDMSRQLNIEDDSFEESLDADPEPYESLHTVTLELFSSAAQ